MPTTIKIAPDLNEIKVRGTKVTTDFNGLHIEYNMIGTVDRKSHVYLKSQLQQAIALSSRPHHLVNLMESIKTTDGRPLGKVKVTHIETGIVLS